MRPIFIILFLFTISCYGENVRVLRIIDGDTFETEDGEKVRLIGLNAPELSDLFGSDAKKYLRVLIGGKVVDLRTDEKSTNRDRYNRLLRYVYLQGTDINRKMIEQGFATAYLKYNFSKAKEYEQVQLIARSKNFGIWGSGEIDSRENSFTEKALDQHFSFFSKGVFVLVLVIILLGIGIYGVFRN